MLKRFVEMLQSERMLSDDVRAQLVDGLFHPFASLVAGAIAGLWIAITVSVLQTDSLVRFSADAVVAIALGRIALGLRYISLGAPAMEKNATAKWELAFGSGAGLFAGGLGLVCLFALLRIDNSALHLMLTTTTAGYAASIAGRNAGRPLVALSQLYLASIPMCLGLMLHDTTFYQVIGLTLFLFMFGMTDITLSIRETLINALETRRRNAELAKSFEKQANLFDNALNNMSRGLLMFTRAGTLLVWNEKFLQVANRGGSALHVGMSLTEFAEWISSDPDTKDIGPRLAEVIQTRVLNGSSKQSFVKLNEHRVVSVSSQMMENGNVVMVFEDVTEQAKANERIKQLAWTDELTGLMNRAAFRELLAKILKLRKDATRIALHLIDLDHFKEVNDTLGHPMGDLLIKDVARRITDVCGQTGYFGRLGGDEFVVIQLLHRPEERPEPLAARLIAAIGETFEISGQRINVGASIGISLAPDHGESGDVLLKRADMALYKAKAHGRNSLVVFEDDLDFQAQERRQLELDIRTAIAQKQFSIVFQPICSTEDGQIELFETLLRWQHPTRGFVSPAEFMPVAEETGLVLEIGRWVLAEACRNAATWKSKAGIAVNFSAVQFTDKSFTTFLERTLRETGFPVERLELEITETALQDDNPDTLDMLRSFRAMGVKISLDDFGTGYSSLSQLRTFPFSKIKIDGSFVRDLGRDASAVAVINAVASIGKIMNMDVVAESVESEDQLSFVISAGCTHVQGYLLSRPVTPEAVPPMIDNHCTNWIARASAA